MILARPFSWLLFISVLVISCEKKQLRVARVAVDFREADSLSVIIYHYPIFDEEVLAQLELDTANHALIQLELSRPVMSYVTINGITRNLYLKPGYDLRLSKDTTYFRDSILFEGEGAPVNNYINHISSMLFWETVLDYDVKSFTKKFDSLTVAVEDFSISYFKRFAIEKADRDLLKQIKKIKLLSLKVFYAYRTHNDALVDQADKLHKNEAVQEIEMLDELQNFYSDIPFDAGYLRSGMFDYKMVLFEYLSGMHLSVFDLKMLDKSNLEWPSQVKARWPRQTNTLIKSKSYNGEIREYLLAINLRHWMNSQGITPEIDSIFDEFKVEFEGSVYTRQLQETYDGHVALSPGAIAPDFSGRTLQGKLVSLKDFRGKVVYVDVWATWCGPCVEEIPYAKKLRSAFPDDKVIFLNVSVDKNALAWKRKLDKEKDWLGTHIILGPQEAELLTENYKVGGIPKYFLIDQMGKIVSSHASRPSSKTIKEEITSLL